MAGKKGRSGPPRNMNAARSVRPALDRLRRGKPLPPELAIVQKGVEREARGLIDDKGGEENMTNGEMALIQNWIVARTAVCLILNELIARGIVQETKNGWDIAPAMRSLSPFLQQERASLLALGLERRELNVVDLKHYLRETYGVEH